MAKQDRYKNLNILAQKIANLEREISLGKNVQENEKKIDSIMTTLSLEDLVYVVSRIEDKKVI